MQTGVYESKRGTDLIRIIVAGEVAEEPQNALWHLFSASPERIGYGAGHYKQRAQNTSAVLGSLLGNYRGEGISMSYTMADFQRDYAKEHFKDLTAEERLEVLKALSAEEQEDIARHLKKLQSEPPSRKGKPRRKS